MRLTGAVGVEGTRNGALRMEVEAQVMPATVYVAEDEATPRWQFIVVFVNRSESQWTLTNCWLNGNFAGVGADSFRHSVPIDGNVIQGARHLSPECVLAIRDPYTPWVPECVGTGYQRAVRGDESAWEGRDC